MCQFVLTIEMPDEAPTPARAIAHILRAVAPVVETQLPPAETGELRDLRNGNQLCSWTFGDAPDPKPVRERV